MTFGVPKKSVFVHSNFASKLTKIMKIVHEDLHDFLRVEMTGWRIPMWKSNHAGILRYVTTQPER
jgi:hypothetical protein